MAKSLMYPLTLPLSLAGERELKLEKIGFPIETFGNDRKGQKRELRLPFL